jgi:4-amino-4-deoxy-L-arabinose transferase-like glycosyltransferase
VANQGEAGSGERGWDRRDSAVAVQVLVEPHPGFADQSVVVRSVQAEHGSAQPRRPAERDQDDLPPRSRGPLHQRMKSSRDGVTHWSLLEVAAILLIALGFRLIQLDEARHPDDYFHIMAALSWLSDGTLNIGGGPPYERAYLFTYIVAAFMWLFGETTYVARLPAVLAGAAWVALLFVWLRGVVGRPAAWIGGLLFCFDTGSLALSHMVRFYTLHGLAFLAAAIGVYYLVTRRPSWRSGSMVALGVVAAIGLAYRLQVTTVVGLVALTVWLTVDLLPRVVTLAVDHRRRAISWGLSLAAVCLVAGFLFLRSDQAALYWGLFRNAPLWAEANRDALGFYFHRIHERYPLFWGLFPAAAVVAIARVGRPAVFAVVLFSVPFFLHSLAAFKAERFLGYAMPFFFATWGIAIGALVPGLMRAGEEATRRLLGGRPGRQLAQAGAWALLALVVTGIWLTTPAFSNAYGLVRSGDLPPELRSAHWKPVASHLNAWVDSVDVVVASSGQTAYYHLDRVDVLVGAFLLGRWDIPEFTPYDVLNVPAIRTPESLETLMRCHRTGLVVIADRHRGLDWAVSEEFVQFVEANTEPVAMPEGSRVQAYTWARQQEVTDAEGCPPLGPPRAARPP